jgi:hypothetical protein
VFLGWYWIDNVVYGILGWPGGIIVGLLVEREDGLDE